MFAKTQKSVSMILGVALVAAASFAAPAFAGEAALSHNERASQEAILGSVDSLPASVDASSATLARNETFARRAIADASTSPYRGASFEAATLRHNEIAAQRAIADRGAIDDRTHADASAATRIVSTRSPTTR